MKKCRKMMKYLSRKYLKNVVYCNMKMFCIGLHLIAEVESASKLIVMNVGSNYSNPAFKLFRGV